MGLDDRDMDDILFNVNIEIENKLKCVGVYYYFVIYLILLFILL